MVHGSEVLVQSAQYSYSRTQLPGFQGKPSIHTSFFPWNNTQKAEVGRSPQGPSGKPCAPRGTERGGTEMDRVWNPKHPSVEP